MLTDNLYAQTKVNIAMEEIMRINFQQILYLLCDLAWGLLLFHSLCACGYWSTVKTKRTLEIRS